MVREQAQDAIAEVLSAYRVPFDLSRGGSFQAIFERVGDALQAILRLRAALKQIVARTNPKGLDARAAIGIGTLDFMADSVAASRGSALQRSVRSLERMAPRGARISIESGDAERDAWITVAARLLDRVISGWSPSQAEAMQLALNGYTQHQIAEMLDITQPSVNNRLKLALWGEIDLILELWQKQSTRWNTVPQAS